MSSSSTSIATPLRRSAAAGEAYQAERAAARSHATAAFEAYEATRRELRQRAQRQRQWAVVGVAKEKHHPRDNAKAARDFRINRWTSRHLGGDGAR